MNRSKGIYQLQILDKPYKKAQEKWYTIKTSDNENYILEEYEKLNVSEIKKRIIFEDYVQIMNEAERDFLPWN